MCVDPGLRAEAEWMGAIAPKLCGFAGIESRRPLLEESSKRLSSVGRTNSFAKLHHFVLGGLFNTGSDLKA
jgi:hypothetical protein